MEGYGDPSYDYDPDDDSAFYDEEVALEDSDADAENDEVEDEDQADDEGPARRPDITTYRTTREIFDSGLFSTEERRREYRRRGKSPSGVIDGEYNDAFLEDGAVYNDADRDWDADA